MLDGAAQPQNVAANLLALQRAAFREQGAPDLAYRRANLDRLKAGLQARRDAFEQAAMSDFGNRAPVESALIDLGPTNRAIGHMRANLARWMRPERRRVGMLMWPGRAQVAYQPLGVVGILSTWNYPVSMALIPLATALAAGNRAVVKPSEVAPATAAVLEEMIGTLFAPDEVAVVNGGADVAAAFSALPFDHLFFTGSGPIGRKVAQAAAANLTPVTLELGGKSPVVLTEDADFGRAARDMAFGKGMNAGQTCIAPDYVLLPADRIESFAASFTAAARELYPQGPSDPGMTSIINDQHAARLQVLLTDARAKGAEVRPALPQPDGAADSRRPGPTLVLHTSDDMAVMQEEIFGPILPLVPYTDLDDAIARINARPHPLALYVYGRDRAVIDRVLDRTTSGNVTVNNILLHCAVDSLPFGGVGESGIGSYHGVDGFRQLSHARGIFRPASAHPVRLAFPPYGRVSRWLARLMLR